MCISAEGIQKYKIRNLGKLTFNSLICKVNSKFWHSLLWALGTNLMGLNVQG